MMFDWLEKVLFPVVKTNDDILRIKKRFYILMAVWYLVLGLLTLFFWQDFDWELIVGGWIGLTIAAVWQYPQWRANPAKLRAYRLKHYDERAQLLAYRWGNFTGQVGMFIFATIAFLSMRIASLDQLRVLLFSGLVIVLILGLITESRK